jgi:nucleotide-binding universal stress UspA family protein
MHVLLAVDGSDQSTRAGQTIFTLASVKTLTILHIVDLPRMSFSMLGPEIAHDMTGIALQSMKEDGKHILARSSSLLTPLFSLTPRTRMEEGSPAELIMSVAQEEKADLIVMGARGKGQIQELLLGSVSQRVLTHASCPVLIVNNPMTTIRNVLLTVQSDEDVERVARFLGKSPFPDGTIITVLTVVPIPRSLLRGGASASEEKVERALKSAEAFLDRAISQIPTGPYQIKSLVSLGSPSQTILEESKLLEPDILMMGMHHPSALTRFILGSVSHTVIHHSTHPILIFR